MSLLSRFLANVRIYCHKIMLLVFVFLRGFYQHSQEFLCINTLMNFVICVLVMQREWLLRVTSNQLVCCLISPHARIVEAQVNANLLWVSTLFRLIRAQFTLNTYRIALNVLWLLHCSYLSLEHYPVSAKLN